MFSYARFKSTQKKKTAAKKISNYTASPMQVDEFKFALRDPKQRLLHWDRTSLIHQEMRYRAEKEKNLVIFIKGPTGIGKSVTALGLWETWEDIVHELNKRPKLELTFSRWQTTHKVRKAQPTDFFLQDEDTILSGFGAKSSKDALQNLINTMRQYQLCFILICPEEINDLYGAHFVLEVTLNNEKNQKNLVKIFNHKGRLIGRAELPILKDTNLYEEYTELKKKNMDRLLQSAGRDSEKTDEEQLNEDMQLIVALAKEKGWELKNKRRIVTACRLGGISGQNDYIELLATFVEMTLESTADVGIAASMKQKQKELVIVPGGIVEKYRALIENFAVEKDIEQAMSDLIANHFELKSYNDIAATREISKNTVSANVKNAERKLRKVSGFFFEQAIFCYMVDIMSKKANKLGYKTITIINGDIVEGDLSIPYTKDNCTFLVYKHTANNLDDKILREKIVKIFSESSSPIPPSSFSSSSSSSFFSSFLSLFSDFFSFSWFGGLSSLDFLFCSPSHHFSFDAKVSHQTYCSRFLPLRSFTIKADKLLPQSSYLSLHPDSSAFVLFWSPFVGLKVSPHHADHSVLVNTSSLPLEPFLEQLLEPTVKQTKTNKRVRTKSQASSQKAKGRKKFSKKGGVGLE